MTKLIMMRGLPGSGKSTRAKEIVQGGGNFVRLNRDLLRTMLHFDKWSGKNEDKTVLAEKGLAAAFLGTGTNVVIDDTNVNPKNERMWRELAEGEKATFEIEHMDTSIDECIVRDRKREKRVGDHVITNMALQYGMFPKPEKGFVLCDLDGTLFDITHRLKYARGEEKNWDKFFDAIPQDVVRQSTVDLLMQYDEKKHPIIFVSARPEKCREATEAKIEEAFKGYRIAETLIMRKNHDKRDDVIVKQEIYDTYFKGKYPIETVIDDRPKVIRMWQANNIPVIDVGEGVEF